NVNFENSNVLSMPDYFNFKAADHWRVQSIGMTLFVPEGKTIYLSNGMENIIYDVKNVTNTWDGDMPGHHWQMTAEGLACLDCDFLNGNFSTTEDEASVRNFDITGFDEVVVKGNINLEIIQSEAY